MRNNSKMDSNRVTPEHKEKVRKEMNEFIDAMNAEYEKDIIHIRKKNSNPFTGGYKCK